MKVKNRILLMAGIAFMLLSGSMLAQITKKAQVGFRFLEYPVSAEVVGKGAVGVVNTPSANGIFWNPALLGGISNNAEISFNHAAGIADINYNACAGAVKIEDVGVIGVSFLSMDYGDLQGTRRATSGDGYVKTGKFSPSAYSAGLSFSQQITDRFAYGVHLKYAKQDLGSAYVSRIIPEKDTVEISTVKYDLDAFALDVGAFYDFKFKGIKFGAVMHNISKEMKYEITEFPLPFSVSFGATIEPLQFLKGISEDHKLVVLVESLHPRDFGEKVKIGGEYTYLEKFIARAGYESNYDERGFTAGLGVKHTFGEFRFSLITQSNRSDYSGTDILSQ